jgi:hypothetical protein
MNKKDVIGIIKTLDLPAEDFVVVGGAALTIRGIRSTDDIDLVVGVGLFEQLRRSGWTFKTRPNGQPGLRNGCVEAYLDVNTPEFGKSTEWLIEHSEIVEGIRFVDLDTLIRWKRGYGRDKDIRDVSLLERYQVGKDE